MAYDYEILAVKKVPIADLVIGKGQARKTQVHRELDKLEDSIRTIGQLHPIVVCESAISPGKLEILTGQRRYLACKSLGQEEIWATILDRSIPEEEAKVISLSENIIKKDLPDQDVIDVCTYLWKIYGDHKIIAEKTGLPPEEVREHVKYISLRKELKDLVDSGTVDQGTALRAQKALDAVGDDKPDTAITLAKELKGCVPTVRAKIEQQIRDGAASTPEEIKEVVKSIKKGPKLRDLVIKLFPEQDDALREYANRRELKREDAALSFITEGLMSEGLLEEAEE
jgi:ParB/RepB/Spo0J family partition protein